MAISFYQKKAINSIKNIDNICYISIASIWEMAIKLSLGKLELNLPFEKIAYILSDNQIGVLPITLNHINKLLNLNFHHRDPFDRIIISQALSEKLTILSKDEEFKKYKVKIEWE